MLAFHSNTERLIDYWRSRRDDGGPPTRMAVDPSDFADVLSQVFILGRVASGVYPVRLAGGLIADLFQRDLRQQSWLSLFRERDRPELKAALEAARRRHGPVVVTLDANAEAASLPMEALLAPLAAAPGSPERYLGLIQPLAMVSRLRGEPVRELAVRAIVSMGPANQESPRLRLATLHGRTVS